MAMRCPTCHKELLGAEAPYRPFCSERCKLIDLDHWLSERYRISTPGEEEDSNSSPGGTGQDDKEESG